MPQDNFFKRMRAQKEERSRDISYLFDPEPISVIDLPESIDKRKFRFDKILKKIVDKYGEEIYEDPALISILQELPDERIHPDTLYILNSIIQDKAITVILDHESNIWEDDIEDFFLAYSKKKSLDKKIVEGIARCIAFSVGMKVEVKPFRSIAQKNNMRTVYPSADEVSKAKSENYTLESISSMMTPYSIPSSPVKIASVSNLRNNNDKLKFCCLVDEVKNFEGRESFFIQAIAFDNCGQCISNENKTVTINGPIGKSYQESVTMEIDKKIQACQNIVKIFVLISPTLLEEDSSRFQMLQLQVRS